MSGKAPAADVGAAQLSASAKKRAAKKKKAGGASAGVADGSAAGLAATPTQPPTVATVPLQANGLTAAAPATTTAALAHSQADLLATANDLYRQIESAAAAALANHLPPGSLASAGMASFSQNGVGGAAAALPPRASDETDDAYWLSLPSHLRSFIRSALPLAAGLAPGSGGANGTANLLGGSVSANATAAQAALNLTPEQMQQAAQQLAQVVQSTGWTGVGLGGAGVGINGGGPNSTTTTTTIPLGSFTLPLHPHPDHLGHVHGSDDGGEIPYDDDEEDLSDLSDGERDRSGYVDEQRTASKKAKKKRKKGKVRWRCIEHECSL